MKRRQAHAQGLVRALRDLQQQEKLTVAELAERLGVSSSTMDMVYAGWRSPGPKLLRGVLRAYPQLRQEVYLFLLRGMSNSEYEDTYW